MNSRTGGLLNVPKVLLAAVLLTGVLFWAGTNQFTAVSLACTFIISLIISAAYVRWQTGIDPAPVPLLPLTFLTYWLAFPVAVFTGRADIETVGGSRLIPLYAIDRAMIAATFGLLVMWAGHDLRLYRRGPLRERLSYHSTPRAHIYLYCVLFIGLVAQRFLNVATAVASGGFRQPIIVAAQFAPLAAFVLLAIDYQQGRATRLDRIALPLYFLGRAMVGLASGWLGSAMNVGLLAILVYAMNRRRFPWRAVLLTLLVVMFLQPGKEEFRTRYWYADQNTDVSVTDRAYDWVATSASLWGAALSGGSSWDWHALVGRTFQRLDLAHQAANVLDLTPSVVPYQYGRLYSYLAATWVPRFMWPSKPSINEANQWYQVAYGLTREENLWAVSIACGYMTEGYINFGWLGLIGIMFAVGVFLNVFEEIFLSRAAGTFLNALGLALVPQLIAAESQLGQYLAGIVQMIALTTLVLLPVLVWKRKAEQRAFAATGRTAGVPRHRVVAPAVSGGPLSPA